MSTTPTTSKGYKETCNLIKEYNDKLTQSQLTSRDFNNKLKQRIDMVKDAPSDKFYFDYNGKRAEIFNYQDFVRYGGDKCWQIVVLDRAKHYTVTLHNDEAFRLKPLGRIRQEKSRSGMVDIFVNEEIIESLFSKIPNELRDGNLYPGDFKTFSKGEFGNLDKNQLSSIINAISEKKFNSLIAQFNITDLKLKEKLTNIWHDEDACKYRNVMLDILNS